MGVLGTHLQRDQRQIAGEITTLIEEARGEMAAVEQGESNKGRPQGRRREQELVAISHHRQRPQVATFLRRRFNESSREGAVRGTARCMGALYGIYCDLLSSIWYSPPQSRYAPRGGLGQPCCTLLRVGRPRHFFLFISSLRSFK